MAFLETDGWAGFLSEERYWSWKERLTNLGLYQRKQKWHEWNSMIFGWKKNGTRDSLVTEKFESRKFFLIWFIESFVYTFTNDQ